MGQSHMETAMSKRADELTAGQLARIKTKGMHLEGRVPGLYFRWRGKTSKCWILRATIRGKRRDLGLGRYPEITLEKARETGRRWREWINQGIHPKEEEERIAAENIAKSAARLKFRDAAEACWLLQKAKFTSEKHSNQWIGRLRDYANPHIGDMYVEDITRADVLKVLQPLWTTITDTASKVRGRIETVIAYYYALRNIEDKRNPAVWEGGLDALLPSAQTLISQRDEHHPALPWQRMPVLRARLAAKKGFGARALEWQIWTTSRGIEVRGARWPEIDFDKGVWTVPASRMKMKRLHRVPLSPAQMNWLRALPRMAGTDLIFPNSKGTMISDATIGKAIKDLHEADVIAARKAGMTAEQIDAEIKACRIGFVDPNEDYRIATPHGTARSSFKDWTRNNLGHRFGDEVSELCLAHVNSDATRAAYARDELIDLRRVMLDEWVVYTDTPPVVATVPTPTAANAMPIDRAVAA
jgi:integrase